MVLFLSLPFSGWALFVFHSDLEGDGVKERIVFSPRSERVLKVFRGEEEVWSGLPDRWEAWKLVVADMDGDRVKELLVGVKVSTRFFPRRHKSVFVLGWNGRFAYARWLCSHLSKPLIDFLAFDVDGDFKDELITLEESSNGRAHLLVYKWIGFGYVGIWESKPLCGVELFQKEGKVGVKLFDGRSFFLSIVDGKLVLRHSP